MKGIPIVLGLTLLLAAGCGKQNASEPTPELPPKVVGQIDFSMDEVKATKALPITTASIMDFGVYAYNTGTTTWAEAQFDGSLVSNWIQNGKISRQGVEWLPDQLYKWGAISHNISFLAYAPYATPNNGITVPQPAVGDLHVKGVATIDFEIGRDVLTQVDFLVAHANLNKNGNSDQQYVRFRFYHTLVKVGFRAFCLSPGTMVRSLTLTDMYYKGSIPLSDDARWTVNSQLRRDFTIELGGVPLSTDPTQPTDLSGVNRFFMLFPQDYTTTSSSKIEIAYTSNNEEIVKSVALAENWEQGKFFLYTLDLGGGATDDLIVDRVQIEDWTLGFDRPLEGETLGKSFNLIYDANGGTGAPASITYKQGEMPKIPTVKPTNGSLTFGGWNTQQDGNGTTYRQGDRIRMSNHITLYAIWQ